MIESAKQLKILVISQFSDPAKGGAERYLQEVTSRMEQDPRLKLEYLLGDVQSDGMLTPGKYFFLTTTFHPAWLREVPAALEKYAPDVLYIHYSLPGLISVALREAKRRDIPVGLMYHSDITGYDIYRKILGRLYYYLLGQRQLNNCTTLFVSSQAYVQTSAFLYRLKRPFVFTPPGVDPIMATVKSSSARNVLLFVGKPEIRSKGFFLLKKAWKLLRLQRPDLELVVIGSRSDHPALQEPGILNVGYVHSRKELARWYAAAAVTVLPSWNESFGMILAEALVSGCPVVASRLTGNAENIQEGLNGYLCQAGDIQSLYRALDMALENNNRLRQAIGERKQEYLERFSWEKTSATVIQTLLKIANQTVPSVGRLKTHIYSEAKPKILVNAVPLQHVQTGIARYLNNLYTAMSSLSSESFDIAYFDGRSIQACMPRGPLDLKNWSRRTRLFWDLPWPLALLLRLLYHANQELQFQKYSGGFDLYHEAGFFPFRASRRMKTVFTLHDLSILRIPWHHPKERELFSRLFLERRCRQVDRFLAVSDFTKSEMGALLNTPEKLVSVTPLASDHIFYPRPKDQVHRLLEKKGWPRAYFLFIGRGDPRKNQELVVQTARSPECPLPLLSVGWSGWSKADNRKFENVYHAGYVTDEELACLYSGATALIFPSSYEGFGLPLLEAMACGCPVVTSRQASLPEVAGEAALYLDDELESRELLQAMQGLLGSKELRSSLREQGLQRARAFSWKNTAAKTYQVFQEIL